MREGAQHGRRVRVQLESGPYTVLPAIAGLVERAGAPTLRTGPAACGVTCELAGDASPPIPGRASAAGGHLWHDSCQRARILCGVSCAAGAIWVRFALWAHTHTRTLTRSPPSFPRVPATRPRHRGRGQWRETREAACPWAAASATPPLRALR